MNEIGEFDVGILPACFIAGENDWGINRKRGAIEAMC